MNIFCIGRNYVAHAKELNSEVPKEPVVFMKPATSLSKFEYPAFSEDVHYECELVFHICKEGKNIPEEDAKHYYDKITVGLDFTARDLQDKLKDKGLPWEKCKGFDGSAFIAGWIDVNDIKNRADIEFQLYKNDNLVQQGFSQNMIFSIEQLIAHISQYFRLHPGDVVFTGTPEGVGPVVPGDILRGTLENREMFRLVI